MKALRFCAIALLVATHAFAQKPRSIELGFKPERVYDFSDVDSVNVMNGNVIIDIPLGLRYPVSSGFSYGLTLVYNSKVWDYLYVRDQFDPARKYLWAKPNLRSNAGNGWRVSMGRLLAPTDSTTSGYEDDFHGWIYESPAGDEHAFSAVISGADGAITTDGSVQVANEASLRMLRLSSTVREVEFPDGQIHRFELETGAWRLKQIRDRFGNSASIAYTYDGTRVTQWSITDSTQPARVHTVSFVYFNQLGDTVDRGMNVASITLDGVMSSTGVPRSYSIDFAYTTSSVTYGCFHDYSAPLAGAPAGSTMLMPMLASITFDDDTSYAFSYYANSESSCSQGLLKEMTLPTLGRIGYGYQLYELQYGGCIPAGPKNSSPGVKTRSLDGNLWTYLLTRGPAVMAVNNPPSTPLDCGMSPDNDPIPVLPSFRWHRTSVVSPADGTGARTRRDHYFNVWSAPDGGVDPQLAAHDATLYGPSEAVTAGWPGEAAAKLAPLAQESTADIGAADVGLLGTTANRSLSEQLRSGCNAAGNCGGTGAKLLRSMYRRSGNPNPGSDPPLRCTISERTLLHDDNGCSGTCWTQSDQASFDYAGHFRDTTLSSNFPGIAGGSTHTAYPLRVKSQLASPSTPWVFTTYEEKSRTVNGETARTTFAFNANGELLRERVLAGSSEGAHDLVTVFTHANGNVVTESSYGGDTGSVAVTTDLPLASLGTLGYRNRYTWLNGVLATSTYVNPPTNANLSFHSLDYTSDPRTGLVTNGRATDGLPTIYDYSPWGRLERITPPGETPTILTYTNATPTSPARITATRSPDVTLHYDYDRLGRLSRTERTLPGAGCVESTITYDNLGRKSAESVQKVCGATAFSTLYRYDALGRITRVTAPDGKAADIAYFGTREIRRTSEIGTKLVTNREEYDVFGRLVRVTGNFNGSSGEVTTTSYGYDVGDRLRSVTATGIDGIQTRTFSYDNRGFLLSEVQPELGVNGYGARSYPIIDSRGHVRRRVTGAVDVTMQYDAAERLSVITETHTGRELERYVYDAFAQCAGTSCQGKLAAAVRYHYDPDLAETPTGVLAVTEGWQYHLDSGRAGRVDRTIGTTSHLNGASFFFTQTYTPLGDVASIHYPCRAEGCAPDRTRIVNHTYANGLLTGVGSWASALTYHASGALDTVTHGSGSSAVLERWTPDPFGLARPATIRATNNSGGELWSSGAYAYDGSGNVKQIGAMTYQYDEQQRLAGWKTTFTPATTYTQSVVGYDSFGNQRHSYDQSCGDTPQGPLCATPMFLPREMVGTTNHYADSTYDDAGNLIDDGHRQFTFDSLGMLTRTRAGGRDLRHLYAPGGERIAIVERLPNGANATTFVMRGFANQLLSVWRTNAAGTIIWDEDAIWRGSSLLAQETPAGTRHTTLDHLGSPRLITAAAAGLPLGTQSFAPFGHGGTTTGGPLQFTGHERDSAFLTAGTVDLPDYFHARFYDPNTGRFLSMDPMMDVKKALQEPPLWNRYSYVTNNPLKFTDPDGRDRYQEPGFTKPLSEAGGWADQPSVSWAFYAQGALLSLAADELAIGPAVTRAFSGAVGIYRGYQASKVINAASEAGVFAGKYGSDVVPKAVGFLAKMSGDGALKAKAFEGMAKIISKLDPAWGASRAVAADGSHVFMGRAGETLVINSKGEIFRGGAKAFKATENGLEVVWSELRKIVPK